MVKDTASTSSRLLLVALALTPMVFGWGQYKQRIYAEPSFFRVSPTTTSRQMAAGDNNDSEEELSTFRQQLERFFGEDEATLRRQPEESSSSEDRVSITKSSLDRIFDVDPSLSEDYDDIFLCDGGSCNLDDDEECQIPDAFKLLPQPQMDVMAFLGIQRAQPLKAGSTSRGESDEWQ